MTPGSKRRISTIALAVLLFAAGALAAEPRPASTLVLLPLDNVAGSDKGRDVVTELLAKAIAAKGWKVVSGAGVETLLEADRVRYLDSLEESSRTKVLTASGGAAIVSGTLYTWIEGKNPVVALSAKMVRTDGTIAWANICGMSANDTEELLGFGRKTTAEEVAQAAVTALMRRFPQPGAESSPLSGPSKPIFRTGPASFRATDFDPATPHRLCVLPFDNASDVPEAARVVADVLALRLAAASGFEVVDSAVLRSAALRARIGSFRWIASEDLAKLAPLVGTTLFLRGTIYKYADAAVRPGVIPELQLKLSLVDINTGRVLWSAQHDRRGSDYLGFLMLGSVSNGVTLTDRVVSEMIGAEAQGPAERRARREDRARETEGAGESLRASWTQWRPSMNVLSLVAAILFATIPPTALDLVLASVNGAPVGSRELIDVFTNRHGGHAKFLGGNAEARTFLNIIIEDRLLIQEAYDIGLDTDADVQKLVAEREAAQASERLITDEIGMKAKVTKEEIRATWEKELNFVVQGRQIAVDSPSEAEEVRNAMLHGSDVEALARACSHADSRFHDGRFVASWGQYEPEWERVVFALQPGEVSPVIATRDGYEVIMLESRIETPRPDFDQVSNRIEAVLRQRRLDERKKTWSEDLWQKYHVQLAAVDRTPAALRRLLAHAPDTAIATWDGGGKMTLRETFSDDDLAKLSALPPSRVSYEIDARIRTTVNDPLVGLEAKERKIAETPDLANEVQRYREYLMEAVLYRDHIFRNLTLTDDDVRNYYDEHRNEFVEPEQRHVAQILVATEEQAKAVKTKLTAGADFEELVRTKSRDVMTAGSGGDLGWITAEKVPPSFAEVLKLAAGETSKPIQTGSGWHIIKVVEIRPTRQLAVDEVRERVREKALDLRKRAARSQWIEKLRAAAKIEIHDAAIERFVKENELKGEAPPQHGMQ